jgi:hypothetical protein
MGGVSSCSVSSQSGSGLSFGSTPSHVGSLSISSPVGFGMWCGDGVLDGCIQQSLG